MAPEDSAATAVRGLKVEPGAYRPMVARLFRGQLSSLWSWL